MADIELLIKIPKEDYKKAIEYGHLDMCGIELAEAVLNGKPLPEGHGDLIDRNKLAHKMVIEDVSRFKGEPEALAGLFLRMCDKEKPIKKCPIHQEAYYSTHQYEETKISCPLGYTSVSCPLEPQTERKD